MATKTSPARRGRGSGPSQAKRQAGKRARKGTSLRKDARVGMAVRQMSTDASRGAEASRTGAYGRIVKLNKTRAEVKFAGWDGVYRVGYEALGKAARVPKGIAKALRTNGGS